EHSPVEARLKQAHRNRRRGDARRAFVLLREACFLAGDDARLWTLYAIQCWRMNRGDDARQALRQALWLRERAHDEPRARVLRRLLDAAESQLCPDSLRAA
ncbi:MAG: hypothetical protein DIU78_005460, partial [Pseudomonadota bacterium]